MSDTTLILIRHGETEWNRQRRIQGQQDSPLTPLGRKQAKRAAQKLQSQAINAAYASDLGRAAETAAIICQALDLQSHPDPDLRERSFGQAEGYSFQQNLERFDDQAFAKAFNATHSSAFGIEPLGDLQTRIFKSLDRIAAENEARTALVITHGGVLAAIFKHIVGLPHDAPRTFDLKNCALNHIVKSQGTWRLETWGDASHLDPQALDEL